MLFSQMIAVARVKSRLSLRELAAKVGASAATLSRIESAGHIPRDGLVIRLIQVLRLNENTVKARIATQRAARENDEAPLSDSEPSFSLVPIVGKIKPER